MQSDNDKNGVSTQMHLREMKNAGPLRPYPRYPVTAFHLEIKADSEGMREQRRKEGMVDELGVWYKAEFWVGGSDPSHHLWPYELHFPMLFICNHAPLMVHRFSAISIKGQTKLDAYPYGKMEALKGAFSVSSWEAECHKQAGPVWRKSLLSDLKKHFLYSPDAYLDIAIIFF